MRKISEKDFNEKYYLYKNTIYSIAYSYVHNSYDADDIVQEVFLKYLKSSEVFDTLDNEKYFLIRVTINTSLSYLKNSWKNKVSLDEEVVNNVKSFDEKKNDEMFEIIYNLPHKYKEVIILHYYEDLSIKDISKIIKISISNVKKRLERARNLIKERDENNG